MNYEYPAIFYKESNGQYSVIFNDLDNLSTYGNDYDDAFNMAKDCLKGHIDYLLNEEKVDLPKASNLNNINPKLIADKINYSEYIDYSVIMVSVKID